jgi:hypothetical protein
MPSSEADFLKRLAEMDPKQLRDIRDFLNSQSREDDSEDEKSHQPPSRSKSKKVHFTPDPILRKNHSQSSRPRSASSGSSSDDSSDDWSTTATGRHSNRRRPSSPSRPVAAPSSGSGYTPADLKSFKAFIAEKEKVEEPPLDLTPLDLRKFKNLLSGKEEKQAKCGVSLADLAEMKALFFDEAREEPRSGRSPADLKLLLAFDDRPQKRDSKATSGKQDKCFVRPVDGKRRGSWGRLMDGVTGSGPDVFVTVRPKTRGRSPDHDRWSNWDSIERSSHSKVSISRKDSSETPWASRSKHEVYNFRTRKYETISEKNRDGFWSHAHWDESEGADRSHKHHKVPKCFRDSHGQWHHPNIIVGFEEALFDSE